MSPVVRSVGVRSDVTSNEEIFITINHNDHFDGTAANSF